jgi:hypothetical protein
MWDDLFKRWIDLLFWWLPRNEEGPPEKEEEGAGVTEQGVEQQVEAVKEVIPDDLTVIKGDRAKRPGEAAVPWDHDLQ